MLYYSTNHTSPKANFKDATINGQAPDKGLYFPERVPQLDKGFIKGIEQYSNEEIAFRVIKEYTGDVIPKNELEKIIAETINFDFPLVKVAENIFSLELYHGPTLAFKDVGARFMSRCLGYFVKNDNRMITVLVATSGDTGGAVADGFYDVEGVNVIILYPAGKVSSVQELQLTTHGKNITAIEIAGSFDDCQHLVKQAFADKLLHEKLFLTSANSINVARWLPQQFYYFFAYRQWPDKTNPPVISVPSGNFGNICAGLLAHRTGLPVKHFVAASNVNDVVHQYLETGNFAARQSVQTISNAMDVGNPSNFIRILHLFDMEFAPLKDVLASFRISDDETRAAIREVYVNNNYLLDPHGAVGFLGLKKYLEQHPQCQGMFLETAHPVKFYDVVEPLIQKEVALPDKIKSLLNKKKQSITMGVEYDAFRDYLLNR